jgi:hypothetical protein
MADDLMLSPAQAVAQPGIADLRPHELIQEGALRATLSLGRIRVMTSELDRRFQSGTTAVDRAATDVRPRFSD